MVTAVQRDMLGQPLPAVPEEWIAAGGTAPEFYVFQAIRRTGRQPGLDFEYQANAYGGRLVRGGMVTDFIIFVPRVGIEVQGARFHFPPLGAPVQDQMRRVAMERLGVRVEFISEYEAINNADAAVRDAIRGTRGRGPIGVFER